MISFSKSAAWLAFCCSFYTWLLLYQAASLLWIWLGIDLFITFLSISLGINKVIRLTYLPPSMTALIRILKITLGTTFFIASIYGAITILYALPNGDKSIIMIPIVILSFFFAGASIGIYQSNK